MSRVGKYPIAIPKGVRTEVAGARITVTGPKGTLARDLHPAMIVEVGDERIVVKRPSDSNVHKSLHGLTRTLVANMVEGVSKGFERSLAIEGVEYRAEMKGRTLVLSLGLSHQVHYEPREGITIELPEPKKISVSGVDKEAVGQTAAEIRALRPPEPYKGKGIRYADEQIKRKAGKAAVGTGF